MIPVTELDVQSSDEIAKALENLTERNMAAGVQAMAKTVAVIQGSLKEYPPESAANRPGRMRILHGGGRKPREVPAGYYERGRGSWRPVKNRPKGMVKRGSKAAGMIRAQRGQRDQGVYAYVLNPTSEQLGRSWATEVQVGPKEIIGTVGTDVSYARHVQGDLQPALFAMRGWRKIDQVVEDVTPDIEAAWDEMRESVHL